MFDNLPKWFLYLGVVLVSLATIPPFLIWRGYENKTTDPRIHIFPDMDTQKKYKPQTALPLFADGRSNRMPVAGTVARGHLQIDQHYFEGKQGGNWAQSFPERVSVDAALLERGEERYDIFCAPCHGLDGAGLGPVHVRASMSENPSWTQPSNLYTGDPLTREVGHLYNTIKNGIRNMPPYGSQVPVADRWAIVAYVKALQMSQNKK